MRKKNKNPLSIVENNLSWWNEVGLGVGILLGYLIFSIYSLFTPTQTIETQLIEPVYANTIIGMIPSPITNKIITGNNSNLDELLSPEVYTQDTPVYRLSPQFNSDGSPKLKRSKKVFSGHGRPVVSSVNVEILEPKLSSPAYLRLRTGNGYIFKPNIYYKGTGYFYKKKTITFPDSLSADSFSLRTGAFFALISVLLFFFKIREKIRLWLSSLKLVKFFPEVDGDD